MKYRDIPSIVDECRDFSFPGADSEAMDLIEETLKTLDNVVERAKYQGKLDEEIPLVNEKSIRRAYKDFKRYNKILKRRDNNKDCYLASLFYVLIDITTIMVVSLWRQLARWIGLFL